MVGKLPWPCGSVFLPIHGFPTSLHLLGASYCPASLLCVLINFLPRSQQVFHTSTTDLKLPFLYSHTLWMICFLLHRENRCQGQSSCPANYPLTCRQRALASFPTHTWVKEASYLLTEESLVFWVSLLLIDDLSASLLQSLSLLFPKILKSLPIKKTKTKNNFSWLYVPIYLHFFTDKCLEKNSLYSLFFTTSHSSSASGLSTEILRKNHQLFLHNSIQFFPSLSCLTSF